VELAMLLIALGDPRPDRCAGRRLSIALTCVSYRQPHYCSLSSLLADDIRHDGQHGTLSEPETQNRNRV